MRWILIATLLVTADALAAQTPATLRVEGVGEPVSVEVSTDHGYPAYPAWTLRALGARVDGTPRGARVVFGADTLRFDVGSPFFDAAGSPRQLVHAAYRDGGIVYLPHQLFAEFLPGAYRDRIEYRDGRLRLTGGEAGRVAAGSAATEPASSAAGSGAASQRSSAPASTPLIVIDAGHGGEDPGRIGPSGLKEKEVVLQVAKRLARELAARGYDVRMTRTRDTLIGLYDRAPMANRWRGDRPGLFLSIHANGVSDRRVRGYETFFLSDARTDDERRVAEMENSAIAYESSSRVVQDDDLGAILNNLTNEFYVRASNSLAGLVQDELGSVQSGHNRGVKQAGFVVLVGAFMPAVLIELAFISNPTEERLLGSGSFQVKVAGSIADAVDRFFATHEQWSGATR